MKARVWIWMTCAASVSACQDDVPAKTYVDIAPVAPPPAETASVLEAQAGLAQAVCPGGAVALQALATGGTTPYAFLWSATPDCGGCLGDATAEGPTVSPVTSALFQVQVTDAGGQIATASTQVTVNAAPVVTVGPDAQIDPGVAVALDGTVSGGAGAWTCNRADCALTGATAAPSKSTTYTLGGTSAEGCTASAATTVWVNLRVTNTIPNDGDEWPVSAQLFFEFDQPLAASSLGPDTIRLVDDDTGSLVPVTTTLGADGRSLYLTPGAGYGSGEDYTLTLVGGAQGILSDDAILPNRLASDVVLSLLTTSADTNAPGIRLRIPDVDAVDVPLNAAVVVAFSEPLDPGTVNLRVSGNGGDVAGTLSYDATAWTAIWIAGADFDANAAYTVSLDVADLSGNTLATSWSFSTGTTLDTAPPEVVAVAPADGALDVTANSTVQVRFSEQIAAASLTGGLWVTAGGAPVAGAVRFDNATFTAIWTPSSLLASTTEYTITVDGVRDLAGNAMTVPFVSTFTTRRVLFADDFENGTAKWSGAWATVTNRYHSQIHSFTESPFGRYASNSSTTAALLAPLDVTGLASVSVDCWRRIQTEKNRDILTFEYRLDGGAWIVASQVARTQGWVAQGFEIQPNGARQLELRVRFTSNETRERDGVYIDDFLVQSP